MGTEMHCKSYFPGFYMMRDLNDDSSNSSWPLYYGDKMVANGQYYNGFLQRTLENGYSGHEKDTLKQKMLEHEAVFKNQVLELHRLYRIQRDMMEEFKRNGDRASVEPASSSSLQGPQVPSEEARKWHMAGFPLSNSSYGRTSVAAAENFSSPTTCTKGNSTQPGRLSFPNGCTTTNSETLDSRPLKVRKKLFDLQLPADEYVDPEEEENLQVYKKSGVSSYSRNGDPNNGPESVMKLFLGSHAGGKTDLPVDASASAVCLRGSIGLADLNEPIHIEEETAPSSIDFLGHPSENGEAKAINQHAKSTASFLSVAGEPVHVRDGTSINSSIESQVNDRGWLSHANRAGSFKGNLSSVTQTCQPDKSPLSSHPGQGTINQVHYPPGMYSNGYNREDKWREGFRHGLESSDGCYSHSNNGQLESIASRTPASYPFFNSSSSFASSWFQTVSSWAHPSSSFTPKVTTLETSGNPVEAISRPLQPSAPRQQSFGENWHVNGGLGSELKSNGFCHAPAPANHGFASFPKGLYHADPKPAIDINLNEEALPKGLANENVILQDLNMEDGMSKPEDNLPALPWLRPKLVHVDEVIDTRRSELSRELGYRDDSSNELCGKNGTVRDLNQLFPSQHMSTSCDSDTIREKEAAAQPQAVKKILGFPIFERDVRENELSSLASASVNVDCSSEGRTMAGDGRKNGIIDINVACEPDEQIAAEEPIMEKGNEKKCTPIKDHIDLNSCVSDSEDPSPPCYEQNSPSVKITLEIDLEVPILPESEDDSTESKGKMLNEVSSQPFENQNKEIQNEVLRDAAETLVGISSCPEAETEDIVALPSEASLGEALLLLSDAISSDSNEVVNASVGNESPKVDSSQELDDFEAMALRLVETKAIHYMPTPFLPELQKVEDTGARPLHTRTRRGHARRGRQWRDFQRDILPGLASLSRHEVTEDLQIFGGMMRATGHTWNSGLARRNGTRNGGARGRRRAVVEPVPPAIASVLCTPLIQQLSSIEAGLEDRSLTGWGKTTRRPRRQRCPAGNPPAVVIT
ncbi:uncharacterized protein LOC131025162 [Salvia miltiorrhiza]|uniref:uncharacterized protein LOC131025162 n=1 Tax=Salvia miltiorrhiza TaxID=226208 RepID=UPI0025AC34C9|nr:uncharacterized protein LOC131025162 [Salvia miltiorrhiza]